MADAVEDGTGEGAARGERTGGAARAGLGGSHADRGDGEGSDAPSGRAGARSTEEAGGVGAGPTQERAGLRDSAPQDTRTARHGADDARAAGDDPGLTSVRVRDARAGDRASLEWVVERFTPLLLEQARYRVGPALRRRLDPEDLVQEVWRVALPALFDGEAPAGEERRATPAVLAFLSRTLLHRVNAHLRRAAVRRAEPEAAQDGPRPADELAERTRGAVTRAAASEERAALARALDRLTPRDREVVVLRGIERLENNVAAELLGETPNAVSLRYNRALEALRRDLPELPL